MKTSFQHQVATLRQCMVIHAFGLIHDNPVMWWKSSSKSPYDKKRRWLSFERDGYYKILFPCFTIADLGMILPEYILTPSGEQELIFYKKDCVFWCEFFDDENELRKIHSKYEAGMKASVLIILIREGYFNPETKEPIKPEEREGQVLKMISNRLLKSF